MTGISTSDRMLEYRLATEEKKRLKGYQLVWFMLKRGSVSLHWYCSATLVALSRCGNSIPAPYSQRDHRWQYLATSSGLGKEQ